MMIQLTEAEYEELMRVKWEHEFITGRLYERIKKLDKDSKCLNKTAFVTNAGDTVQNIEWVKCDMK